MHVVARHPVNARSYDYPERDKGNSFANVIPEMAAGAATRINEAVQGAVGPQPDKCEEAARKLRGDVEGIKEGGDE